MHDSRRRSVPRFAAAAAALTLALLGAPALAGEEDRPATPEELARVKKALEAKGYSNLREPEVDCRFEVDAKNKAGQDMELEVDLETLEILEEDPK